MKPIGSSTLKIKKLTTPKKKIRNIIKRLPDSERIDLCASACFAISNIYPILTSDPKEVLDCYYNKRFMTRILAYLQHEKSLKLPKHITLKVNGRKLYIGPTYTKIPERELKRHNIKQEELEDCFVITKQQLSAEHDNLDSRNIMEAESLQNISDHSDHEFNENTFGNIRDDNANSEESENDVSMNTSTTSDPDHIQSHYNIFKNPEKCSSEKIQALIHITKEQFLDFTNMIFSHMKLSSRPVLPKYSEAFLYRLKVNFNWTICLH